MTYFVQTSYSFSSPKKALGSYTLTIVEGDDGRTAENRLESRSSASMVTYQGHYDDFEKMLRDISDFIVADFSIVAIEGLGAVSYELRNMAHKAKQIDDFLTERLVARRTPASSKRPGTSKSPGGLYIAPAYRNEAQTA